jgi:hypothetical protein
MKKLAMVAAVVACASIVSAQTVTSQNIVGYTKVTATGGQLELVALNFDTGGLTVSQLFDALPSSSYIYLWDKASNTYISSQKGRSGWSPDPVVNNGDALWIKAASGSTEIVLAGEVLLAETNVVGTIDAIEATGLYYPVAVQFGSTALSGQLPSSSYLYIWNGSTYDSYQKGRSGWGAGDTEVINVAQGFWIKPASSFDWEEPRPFTP